MSSPSESPSPHEPPEAWGPLFRFARAAGRPLERFLHIEAASGILLLLAAGVALIWANSPWAASYFALWHTPLGLRIGAFHFERSLEWLVNDALMVIFFFVVGMEIRREVYEGELSEWRRAVLPVVAALGGMLAPAVLYLCFANTPAAHSGWGVPMATDIAFAVGVLTLLGSRVPPALRVLLLALAVIDDLGAILVIAMFYSSHFVVSGLFIAGLGLGAIAVMQRIGVRWKLAYVAPGMVIWAGISLSGVHPTIAGVIVGVITPVRAWFGPEGFVARLRALRMQLHSAEAHQLAPHELHHALQQIDMARREATSPAVSLIATLHPWVAFGIMPLFALTNAGVSLAGLSLDATSQRVALGTGVGLALGKPLGIWLAVWTALKLGLGRAPVGLQLGHWVVLGVVAGIGFTMALFIAQLAFDEPSLLAAGKLGVLVASGCAALAALGLGRWLLPDAATAGAATTADEAERSTVL
jgi:NhaA family Na+:H+ antiporter